MEPIKNPRADPKTKNHSLLLRNKVIPPITIKKIKDKLITYFGPTLSSKYQKNSAPSPAVIFIKIPKIIISEKLILKVPAAYKPPNAKSVFNPSV